MKICFITHTIFNLGGVQRVVSVLSSSLAKDNDITILCLNNKFPINRKIYNLNSDVKVEMNVNLYKQNNIVKRVYYKGLRYINKNNILKVRTDNLFNAYYYRYNQDKLISYINDNGFDVVIGVEGNCSMLLASIASSIKSKTIGWQHNSYEAYLKNKNRYYWNQDKIFEEFIPRLDKYIVLNEYDKKMYKKEMNINCDVMENPVSFISEEKSDLTKKNFLAAGRFTRQKGFDLLIESFNEFSKIDDNWTLTIVGEGEDENSIKELVKEYNLEKRISIQPFSNNIREYFLNSSALLLSSRWEGMPMIALEALVMGVPIIAYDITAIQPIIDDREEGIIVQKFDTKMYAKAMKQVSESYELRCSMSEKAIKKSKKFNIKYITNKWNKYLNKI